MLIVPPAEALCQARTVHFRPSHKADSTHGSSERPIRSLDGIVLITHLVVPTGGPHDGSKEGSWPLAIAPLVLGTLMSAFLSQTFAT